MKILIDEDTGSAVLIALLRASGHEVVQLSPGLTDEVVFTEAQKLAIPILTANVGRKGRRDPQGLYKLALERIPHCGVIGIFRPAPTRALADRLVVEALTAIAAQEQLQPGTALRRDDLTRLNDFLSA